MSRMTHCLLTAGVMAIGSIGLMAGRYCVLGNEILVPRGPGTYKVTLVVNGTCTAKNARVRTVTPLDFGSQHVVSETSTSEEMAPKVNSNRHPENRYVLWSPRPGSPIGPFQVRHEFFCTVDAMRLEQPSWAAALYAKPQPGEYLVSEPAIECDDHEITQLARRLTSQRTHVSDQVDALFQYVDRHIANDPSLGSSLSAADCLKRQRGDARAKSRLLAALCRSRGIPARLVVGLALKRAREQQVHVWAEAWFRDHWQPLCAYHHHRGRLPASYLVLGFGDLEPIRGRNVTELAHTFLVEHMALEESAAESNPLRGTVKAMSLGNLPPSERHLVEFLLLVPIAALIVCVFRNVIGVPSFGTFAPALIGLAFRDLFHSVPGIMLFLSIILVGWGLRRWLDGYHLLQVPRTALLLSLVVVLLVTVIAAANARNLPVTQYVSLFPIIILTGMIERFWTLEAEDGAVSSLRTLLATLAIALSIALILNWRPLGEHLIRFPETLGLVMAAQLLLGRYTGYRLSELLRFRDFLHMQQA